MSLLYLMKFTVEYQGYTQKELIENWIKEAERAMASKEKGALKQIWKVVGERQVLAVLQLPPQHMDLASFSLPMMKAMGEQIQMEISPLRPYEGFANDLNQSLGITDQFEVQNPVSKAGLFFWLTFSVEYSGMLQDDLFRIWSEEAKAALAAKKAGVVVDIWKVVAERKVHALLCVNSADELDKISSSLPIMQKMGDKVHIDCKSVRPYEEFYEDLKKLAASC